MDQFVISKVQGYRGASFPRQDKSGSLRRFLSRTLSFLKITLGVALLVTMLETSLQAQDMPDICKGDVTVSRPVGPNYTPVELSGLVKSPQTYKNNLCAVRGTLILVNEKVGDAGVQARYFLSKDNLRVLLEGNVNNIWLNKTVEVHGRIDVTGEKDQNGQVTARISVQKIVPVTDQGAK